MTAALAPFRSILVPLDGSPLAEQALPLAADLARRTGGKLKLVLVHRLPPPPIDPVGTKVFTSIELATRKAERAYLRGVQTRLREGGVPLTAPVTLRGSAGPALARYVQELGIDLVIMATHGRGGIRRAWLGSVADYLIRHLRIPVLAVRPAEDESVAGGPSRASQILVPLDGSDLAEAALEPAAALARAWGHELTLMQVVSPVQLAIDAAVPFPSAYDQELTEMWRKQAQDYLADVAERLRGEGLRATGVAIVGWNTVTSLLEVARPDKVALVVLATHGHGGLRRIALGSVADKLVRGAEVPVLVCRPARPGKPRQRSLAQSRSRGHRAAQEVGR
ncbi:MAG: universal stress protein [Gemmatimonadales bacterium]